MRHLGLETAGYHIRVVTKDGIVSLEGVVPSAAVKEEAERIARSISGVWRVINRLEVGGVTGVLP